MFTFCILLYASKRNLNIAQEEDQLSVTQLRKIRGICQTKRPAFTDTRALGVITTNLCDLFFFFSAAEIKLQNAFSELTPVLSDIR